ncbi:MAG: hypothetical protein AABX93_00910 [Nanoarchaeota archaeon]
MTDLSSVLDKDEIRQFADEASDEVLRSYVTDFDKKLQNLPKAEAEKMKNLDPRYKIYDDELYRRADIPF